MGHALIDVVQAEGEREHRAILQRAEERARSILAEAELEARSLLEQEPFPPATAPDQVTESTLKTQFLRRYADQVEQLRVSVHGLVEELDPVCRAEALVSVLAELLADLPPGEYRVYAARSLGTRFAARFPEPSSQQVLRWFPEEEEDALRLESGGGSLRTSLSVGSLIDRFFATETERVTRILLGDDTC